MRKNKDIELKDFETQLKMIEDDICNKNNGYNCIYDKIKNTIDSFVIGVD